MVSKEILIKSAHHSLSTVTDTNSQHFQVVKDVDVITLVSHVD